MATMLEITGRIRKRKHEINPSIHILWIISHLWKTHESHQCSLTWKDIRMSLNGLKRKASCWVNVCNMIPSLFFLKKTNRKQEVACMLLAYRSLYHAHLSLCDTDRCAWYRNGKVSGISLEKYQNIHDNSILTSRKNDLITSAGIIGCSSESKQNYTFYLIPYTKKKKSRASTFLKKLNFTTSSMKNYNSKSLSTSRLQSLIPEWRSTSWHLIKY